ncbi:MAG: hypothetical protein LBH43_19455 [Treponema sp.]|nr:hypothetical protein [Treponema sp.]
MKQKCFILALTLALSACPVYDGLPEPELPVEYIEFSDAKYVGGTHSIVLSFASPFSMEDYTGIYSYYNKSSKLDMALYIKEGGSDIIKTEANDTGISISLKEDKMCPPKLVFNTKSPMYLSNRMGNFNEVIEAKAFIKTTELRVQP